MKKGVYIVYDENTFKPVRLFDWYGKAEDFAKANGYKVMNRTHPINKELLKKINLNPFI